MSSYNDPLNPFGPSRVNNLKNKSKRANLMNQYGVPTSPNPFNNRYSFAPFPNSKPLPQPPLFKKPKLFRQRGQRHLNNTRAVRRGMENNRYGTNSNIMRSMGVGEGYLRNHRRGRKTRKHRR